MGDEMVPPEGDMVDATDFWSKRNRANDATAPSDDAEQAVTEVIDTGSGDASVAGTRGWVAHGGHVHGAARKPVAFKRLLVANRGEIARRVFRTARGLGIETIAVYSDPDANSAHVRDADLAVALGGTTSTESYLDTGKILEAAARSGADAIHPGYGFLSENPDFAQAVMAAGLTWVGPTPESIRSMALKVEAKRLAEAAGVPLVPGAELAADVTNDQLERTASEVGFPLLVKASAGGGGKGMRVINSPDELIDAVDAARREAQNSFGDPTVFFERYLTGARHVEVQVFGDTHGNVVHLFERECSIQRRHQKIVEESPSPGTTPATLDQMYAAAVSLASQIGYVGAGTVEFLVFGEGAAQEFFFLEMNTRLQVEHPVTEEVTGLDLVEWQLQVASGHELPYPQGAIARNGHAIEVRLYAEDPANNYLPSTGRLVAFGSESSMARYCRKDSGFDAGDEVSPFYDPMLAKIISQGSDRAEAIDKLATNLRQLDIAGVITNRDSLVAILESPEFADGATTTDFLDKHPHLMDAPTVDVAEREALLVAAALSNAWFDRQSATWGDLAFGGWRNISAVPQRSDWELDGGAEPRRFAVVWSPSSASAGSVELRESEPAAGWTGPVRGHSYAINMDSWETIDRRQRAMVNLELDGIRKGYTVGCADDFVWVTGRHDCLTFKKLPRFVDPDHAAAGGGPAAPVPGTVVSVEISAGDEVTEGQTLIVLEAMKMEHRITAAVDGVVDEVLVNTGDSVDAHQVLVTLQ